MRRCRANENGGRYKRGGGTAHDSEVHWDCIDQRRRMVEPINAASPPTASRIWAARAVADADPRRARTRILKPPRLAAEGTAMRKLIVTGIAAAALLAPAAVQAQTPAQADARPPVRLMCASWEGGFHWVARLAPRRCEVPLTAPVKLALKSWQNWGKPYAKARATVTFDDGSRARGMVTVYRRRPDCTDEIWVYTRLRVQTRGYTFTAQMGTCST
jgi:hypothetical protein